MNYVRTSRVEDFSVEYRDFDKGTASSHLDKLNKSGRRNSKLLMQYKFLYNVPLKLNNVPLQKYLVIV